MSHHVPTCQNPDCLHPKFCHYPANDIKVLGDPRRKTAPKPALVGQCATVGCGCAAYQQWRAA